MTGARGWRPAEVEVEQSRDGGRGRRADGARAAADGGARTGAAEMDLKMPALLTGGRAEDQRTATNMLLLLCCDSIYGKEMGLGMRMPPPGAR